MNYNDEQEFFSIDLSSSTDKSVRQSFSGEPPRIIRIDEPDVIAIRKSNDEATRQYHERLRSQSSIGVAIRGGHELRLMCAAEVQMKKDSAWWRVMLRRLGLRFY